MPRRLAPQRMTLSDFEWPFHASRTISAVAELLVHLSVDLIRCVSAIICSVCPSVSTELWCNRIYTTMQP